MEQQFTKSEALNPLNYCNEIVSKKQVINKYNMFHVSLAVVRRCNGENLFKMEVFFNNNITFNIQ